jgi:hypothetical protein
MPGDYFKNHEVFWKAAEKFRTLHEAGLAKKSELGIHIKFDDRNLLPLACLMIDTSGIPEDKQVEYFVAEYEKIHKAFDTPGPNDPQRPDPEKIKPYIKAMFDKIVTDLDTIDYNNERDIIRVLNTMYATQMIATMVKDFPKEAMEVFPTIEERKKADTISSKAFALQLDARVKMSYEGLDDIGDYHNQFGKNATKDPAQTLQAKIFHTVADSMLKSDNRIIIDPTEDELASQFFLGESFTVSQDIGSGPMDFTEKDYSQYFGSHFADSKMNSVFEYSIYSEAETPNAFQQGDVLMINGRPYRELVDEVAATRKLGYYGNRGVVGDMMREALLNGDPVTLISSSFDENGKIKFENRDIRIDLDKLNELDRQQNYSWIRRVLDTIGIWSIPKQFPTNKARDAKLSGIFADPNSTHSKALKAQEDKIISLFNSKKHLSGISQVLGKISRDEVTNEKDVSQNKDLSDQNREKLENIELDTNLNTENAKVSDPVEPTLNKNKDNVIGGA